MHGLDPWFISLHTPRVFDPVMREAVPLYGMISHPDHRGNPADGMISAIFLPFWGLMSKITMRSVQSHRSVFLVRMIQIELPALSSLLVGPDDNFLNIGSFSVIIYLVYYFFLQMEKDVYYLLSLYQTRDSNLSIRDGANLIR